MRCQSACTTCTHDGRPDQPEYIELANVSGHTIDLGGLMLSGPSSGDGHYSLQRIVYQPLALQPGQVAVVYDLPTSVGDAVSGQFKSMTDAFPQVWPDG
ncbi:MAG: hypothetical protein R3324_16410, partial [Halobacteriales archaeon]|nr:hypothetical protein [Halobacteriales archaeon]